MPSFYGIGEVKSAVGALVAVDIRGTGMCIVHEDVIDQRNLIPIPDPTLSKDASSPARCQAIARITRGFSIRVRSLLHRSLNRLSLCKQSEFHLQKSREFTIYHYVGHSPRLGVDQLARGVRTELNARQ